MSKRHRQPRIGPCRLVHAQRSAAERARAPRYEHAAPGALLHIDTKKLGRIEHPHHRVTGNRRNSVEGAGWEMLFDAIDDHARIAFTAMQPDEKKDRAVQFLHDAVAYYARLGVTGAAPPDR